MTTAPLERSERGRSSTLQAPGPVRSSTRSDATPQPLRLVKGSHIVLPRIAEHDSAAHCSKRPTSRAVVSFNREFARYRVPRITDTPEIDVRFVGDDNAPSTGAGEPGIVPISAAISNAVLRLNGQRHRELPIQRHL